MILISTIIFLINLLSFILLIRFGNMIVIIIEIITLIGLLIYYLIKTKRRYIKSKLIIYIFLLSILQFLIFLLFNKFDLIYFPTDLDGALNSVITIILFSLIDIVYIIILLSSNLIKFILNKIEKLNLEEGK